MIISKPLMRIELITRGLIDPVRNTLTDSDREIEGSAGSQLYIENVTISV